MIRLQKPLVEIKAIDGTQALFDGYIKILGRLRPFEYKKKFCLPQMAIFQQYAEAAGCILFTDYLQPAVADALIENGIEFADLAGNLFLKEGETLILIQNCKKPPQLIQAEAIGRAFAPAGVKVLFLLLTEPDALSWSYRKIHEYTGVSMGSIKYIMADLQERKYLVQLQGKFHIPDYPLLVERWTNAYLDKLYCKCEVERYDGELSTPLEKFSVSMTGESAAAELHLMKAAKTTLYRWGNINEMIARNRWKKNPDGNIEIRVAFWPEIRILKPQVPHLLVYADLLAENDSRCTETAKVIYDRYLKEKIR